MKAEYRNSILKNTSFSYGEAIQLRQAEKYRKRDRNHWSTRIDVAFDLVRQHVQPRFENIQPEEIVVADIACSIGTFAIEFAKRGYRSYGIDFDESALKIAQQLAKEENVEPTFIHADITTGNIQGLESIDIAVCMDVFEHLHSDELGAMLQTIRQCLSPNGCLVFHTFPTYYDYIFQGKQGRLRLPLVPFRNIRSERFNRLVRSYSALLDILLLVKKGQDHRDQIKKDAHCNPLTLENVTDILKRARFNILFITRGQLYGPEVFSPNAKIQQQFKHQPISYRNIYGVAAPE